jgi:hypothetical protein
MQSLKERVMLVFLSISQWTARKLDKKVTQEVADNHGSAIEWGRYNKSLIAKDAIRTIAQVADTARTYHYENTLPWLDTGARAITAAHYLTYTEKMRQHKSDFENAVSSFLDNYPALKEDARASLNGLYRDDDYPPVPKIQRRYAFDVQVFPLPDAADFRVDLADDVLATIRQDIEQRTQTLTGAAMRDLWTRLHDAVSHMADRLSTKDAIFRDSLVGNIADICGLLPRLNLTQDPDLEKMRQEVESRLTMTSATALRENTGIRETTAQAAQEIMAKMAAYMA